MTSKSKRDNPLFMRNNFDSVGKRGIPLIKKQELTADDIMLVAFLTQEKTIMKLTRKKGYLDNIRNSERQFLNMLKFIITKDLIKRIMTRHPPKQSWIFSIKLWYDYNSNLDFWGSKHTFSRISSLIFRCFTFYVQIKKEGKTYLKPIK